MMQFQVVDYDVKPVKLVSVGDITRQPNSLVANCILLLSIIVQLGLATVYAYPFACLIQLKSSVL